MIVLKIILSIVCIYSIAINMGMLIRHGNKYRGDVLLGFVLSAFCATYLLCSIWGTK